MKLKQLLFLLLCMLYASNLFAVDYYVKATGNDLNDGLTESTSFLTLGQAVATASNGDKIIIIGSVSHTAQISFNKTLSFEGQSNATLTSNGTRFFTIPGGTANTISFTNITFQNAATNLQGAVLNNSTQTGMVFNFTNCNFVNNTTSADNGGGVFYFAQDAQVNITACTFRNNAVVTSTATNARGGAINFFGTVTAQINNCTFFGNKVAVIGNFQGAAIRVNSAGNVINVSNSLFYNNRSNNGIGASADFNGAATATMNILNSIAQNQINADDVTGSYFDTNDFLLSSNLFWDSSINKITFSAPNSISDITPIDYGSDNSDVGAWDSKINLFKGTSNSDWATGDNWSSTAVPASDENVTLLSDSPALLIGGSTNATINSLELKASSSLTVNSGANLTVTNAITNNGSLTLENNANLIQTGTTNTNTGAITVKRNSSPLVLLDYSLWSSPVQGQQLQAFSPQTLPNRFYTYNTAANQYTNNINNINPNNDFEIGKGYLIRMPNNHPDTQETIWSGVFVGVPNNGDIDVTLSTAGNRFNLVGNPYPSPINISNFIAANSANIEGSIWFWRKANSSNNATVYPTWNGGTLVGNAEPNGNPGNITVIRTGQGFFVQALASPAGSLVFNNTMRAQENTNQFFKAAPKNIIQSINSVDKHRVWLHLTNAIGHFYEQAVSFIEGGTATVDSFDARSINTGDMLFNSIIPNQTEQYIIQSRALPFNSQEVIPLAVKITTPGTYSISVSNKDGLFADGSQPIYLKDNLTNTIVNLNDGVYSFTSVDGEFNDRFELKFNNEVLSVPTTGITESDVLVFLNSTKDLEVHLNNSNIKQVTVFDLGSRMIMQKNNINQASFTWNMAAIANQILLVKVEDINGVTVTKKMIR